MYTPGRPRLFWSCPCCLTICQKVLAPFALCGGDLGATGCGLHPPGSRSSRHANSKDWHRLVRMPGSGGTVALASSCRHWRSLAGRRRLAQAFQVPAGRSAARGTAVCAEDRDAQPAAAALAAVGEAAADDSGDGLASRPSCRCCCCLLLV